MKCLSTLNKRISKNRFFRSFLPLLICIGALTLTSFKAEGNFSFFQKTFNHLQSQVALQLQSLTNLSQAEAMALVGVDDNTLASNNTFIGLSAGTYTIKAEASGDATCLTTQSVTVDAVMDVTPPIAMCNDLTITLDNTGNYTLTAADLSALSAGSTDNSGGALTTTASQMAFDCDDLVPPAPPTWEDVGTAGFSAAVATYQSLAIYNGEPYVAYRDWGNDSKTTVMRYDGSSWVTVGTAGFSAGIANYQSLSFYNGEPYVAYRDGGNGNETTVMRYDGSSWVHVGTAGFSAGEAEYQSLSFHNGEPYVAYRDWGNGSKTTVMRYDGSSWVNVGTAGFSAGVASYQSLSFDNGEPYVAYQDGGNGFKTTVMRYDGNSWVHVGTAGFSVDFAQDQSLAIYNGEPYVAYRDSGNGDKTTVMRYDGSSWVTVGTAGFSAGVASFQSLSFYNGEPYVAYRDGGNGNKTTVMRYDGSSWVTVGTAGFSAGITQFPSLAIYNGEPYVAYRDFENVGKATVMKFPKAGTAITVADAAGNQANCTSTITVLPPASDFSIADVSQAEGQSGTSTMTFTVTRTNTACAAYIDYATTDGIATVANSDYVAATGTASFAAGAATTTIDITINGDTTFEGDETFTVTLSNPPTNGTITDATATGTIEEDDCTISIDSTTPMIPSCSGGNDGSIAVAVTCTSCTGAVNYYVDNVANTLITDNTLTGLAAGTYIIKVADANDATCFTTESVTVSAGVDVTPPTAMCNDLTITLDNTGNYTLTAANLSALSAGSTDNCGGALTTTASQMAFDCDDLVPPAPPTWEDVGTAGFSAAAAAHQSLAIYNGEPYVAYLDVANGNKATVMRYDGSSWVTVGTAGFSAGTAFYQSLAFYNGQPYVAYTDTGNGHKTTVMRYDGSSWVNVGNAGFSAGSAYYQSLAFYNGEPYVAYNDSSANGDKTTVMRYDGSNWVTVGSAGFSAGKAAYQSLAFYNGEPYVAYRDVANADKTTVMRYDGSSWMNVGTAGFSAGIASFQSLAFNNGEPYVAYRDAVNGNKMTVMRYDGSSWATVGNAGFSASIADYQSLAIYNGEPYVAYRDEGNGFKTTVMRYDGSSWVHVGTAGFSAAGGDYQSLAIYNGEPYVAYRDYGNGDKTTVMKFPKAGTAITVADAAGNQANCISTITVLPPASDFSIADVSQAEGQSGTSTMSLTITRTNPACAGTIDYATTDGTATVANSDYVAATGTASFAAGAATTTIDVTINGDTTFEGDETFMVTLSNPPTNGTITDATATGTIEDDDCTISITNTVATNEGCLNANDGTITVTATCASCAAATDIRYSTDGTDFTNTTGIFTGLADGTYTVYVRDVNDATCTANQANVVIVAGTDAIDPTFTCPSAQDVNLNGTCQLTVPDLVATVNDEADNCMVQSFTQSPTAGTSLASAHNQTHTVTLTLTDVNGNDAECTVTLTAKDITPPTFTCPSAMDVNLNGSCALIVPDLISSLTATDNCAGTTFAQLPAANAVLTSAHNMMHTVTITATDAAGLTNVTVCTVTLTAKDVTPPTFTCPSDRDVNIDTDCQITVPDLVAEVTDQMDNCATTFTTTQMPAGGAMISLAHDAMQDVTVTVTDGNGNTTDCTVTLTAKDMIAPVAACPTNTVEVILDVNGNGTLPANALAGGNSTDNCMVTETSPMMTYSCTDLGVQTVTLTATDGAGLTNTIDCTIMVIDNIGPVAMCQDITVVLDNTGNIVIAPDAVNNGSTDACSLNFSTSTTHFSCADTGAPVQVTMTVMDDSGNSSQCTANVTVEDNTAPIASCQPFTLFLDNTEDGVLTATDIDNGSMDACGIQSLAVSQSAFDCSQVGTHTVTLTVTDNNGNVSTCDAVVTVDDSMMPTLIYVDKDATGTGEGDTWVDAFTDLQAALALAASCPVIEDIWIAEGIYKPTAGTDRTKSFHFGEYNVIGGFAGGETNVNAADPFANPVILCGDLNEDDVFMANDCNQNISDNSYTVVVIDANVTAVTEISGLTIRRGHGEGNILVSLAQRAGGGVDNHGSPTMEFVTITENCAEQGAGMYNFGLNAVIDIEFRNCRFINNHSPNSAGAVYNDGRGSGMCTPSFISCEFMNNSAGAGGGAVYNNGSSGGICSPEFINCTFSGNEAPNAGAAIYNLYATPIIKGSMFHDNSNLMPISDFNSTVDIENTIVEGNYQGMSNANPQFVVAPSAQPTAPQLWDLSLQQTSPAIDEAIAVNLPSYITKDVMGNPRTSGAGIDLGAHEYQGAALPVELTDFTVNKHGKLSAESKWNTSTESSNKGWTIMRSQDGQTWKSLGFVEGRGTSLTPNDYRLLDETAHLGWNYYQLYQEDFDGTITKSVVRNVYFENSEITIYPNPTQDELNIVLTSMDYKDKATIEVLNELGQLLRVIKTESIQTKVDLTDLPSGAYTIRIQMGNELIHKVIIKE